MTPLWAAVRGVNLKAELRAARLVAPIEVLDYTPDGLLFRLKDGPTKQLTARYWGAGDSKWVPTDFAPLDFNQENLTSEWPPKGSEVVIVVGADNTISLFAWKRGSDYRFWSPWMTGSSAGFTCEPPAKPLPGQANSSNSSWDGCLLPVAAVEAFLKK